MTALPPNLPDARTAQRLLDMLAQLEQSFRNNTRQERQITQVASTENQTRLANLQFENQRLRNSRKQAAERLEILIERLKQQAEENPEASETDEAMALMQDNAA